MQAAATCETISSERTSGSNSRVPLATLSGLVKASLAAGDKAFDKAEQHFKAAGLYLIEARERLPIEQPGKRFTAYIVGECKMQTSRAYELIAIAEGRLTLEEIRAKKNESSKAAHAKTRAAAKSGFPLNSGKTNSEPDEGGDEANSESEVAAPEVLEDNILHAIGGMNENARVFNKLLKISAFDREAVTRVNTAIDGMIGKWRSIQSTLKKKAVPRGADYSEPTEEDCEDCNNDSERWERSLSNMAGDAISIRAFWDKTFGKEWTEFDVPSTAVTLAKQAAKEWTELAADLTKRRKAALN
jgi:hypothetical protein